ncbi:DUF2062 domain-containing protein [Thiolinea disciformis]|uniref:DUF2062 domain-containing protein n=1 Tax=Thiolinea disciformis TaxID=125614 RepID=UPI000476CA17|nr:DUF2062 domain-containing protein [Thiolinea disciformis]
MPKQFFKKFAPHPDVIKNNKYLSFLGQHLHLPNLWHFNRRSIAAAIAVGGFAMWIPIPAQTLLAAILAVFFRANLPLSVAMVFITNPVTMPPLMYAAYALGAVLTGQPLMPVEFHANLETLIYIWKPFLVGSIVLALATAVVGYFGTNLLWRAHLIQRVRNRRKRRLAKLS